MRTVAQVSLVLLLLAVAVMAVPETSEAVLIVQVSTAFFADCMTTVTAPSLTCNFAGNLSIGGALIGRWHSTWYIECIAPGNCSTTTDDYFVFDDQTGIRGVMNKSLPGFPADFRSFACGGGVGGLLPVGALIAGTKDASFLTGGNGFTYTCQLGTAGIALVYSFFGPGL